MALSFKDKETDQLSRAVAALTDAIRIAVTKWPERERLHRGEHCAALHLLAPTKGCLLDGGRVAMDTKFTANVRLICNTPFRYTQRF